MIVIFVVVVVVLVVVLLGYVRQDRPTLPLQHQILIVEQNTVQGLGLRIKLCTCSGDMSEDGRLSPR